MGWDYKPQKCSAMRPGSCTRKKVLRDKDTAVDVVRRMVEDGLIRAYAYQCEHCGYWHVTSGEQKRRVPDGRPG